MKTDRLLLGELNLNIAAAILLYLFITPNQISAQASTDASGRTSVQCDNGRVKCTVMLAPDHVVSDRLEVLESWSKTRRLWTTPVLETDAGFAIEVMYTDWQVPGKVNNGDNPALFTDRDFALVSHAAHEEGGSHFIVLDLKGKETTLDVRVTYRLDSASFFIRRSIAIRDTAQNHHFLRWIWARQGSVNGIRKVIKSGGFGQPVACELNRGGAFFGLEYPASENHLSQNADGAYDVRCGQEWGGLIGKDWTQSEWVVEAVTPTPYVKDWFFTYLDAVRVAPLRPYTLYNSWYDLRSPEYPKVPPENFMSEESAMRMIKLLRTNMIEKHGIQLDAFVLDDGWDVYESDWALRTNQFPRGFKPLAEELNKTKTSLGIWLGPSGGYSFRKKRLAWMKNHGYELVGNQLCVAGKKYRALFNKRVADFVEKDGAAYFKWDGIQFSCSEPDHGHPIDIYSRRAVLESVGDWCRSVRDRNPAMFLNITSGTWMSPWWLKYANTVWMQGYDYGYADVPSISQRDGAITYRDFVLYDGLRSNDLWFPIANLMTHGIIKGKLELLGSSEEPLDKFTDDALLYVARGVSMYELYISPDILSDGEWNTLAASLTWARDRFPTLTKTYLVGGNPLKREPYGYTHFRGEKGVIAARNPFITPSTLEVELAVSQGLDPDAGSLVLERVYPTRWISPRLYRAGDNVRIELDGYETAVYELYPVAEATGPLLAGVVFEELSSGNSTIPMVIHSVEGAARILNPNTVVSVRYNDETTRPGSFSPRTSSVPTAVFNTHVRKSPGSEGTYNVSLSVDTSVSHGLLALLLTPDASVTEEQQVTVSAILDGNDVALKTEKQEGKSQWYTIDVVPGDHQLGLIIKSKKGGKAWKGSLSAWAVVYQRQPLQNVELNVDTIPLSRILPPRPWAVGEVRENFSIGDVIVVAPVTE